MKPYLIDPEFHRFPVVSLHGFLYSNMCLLAFVAPALNMS